MKKVIHKMILETSWDGAMLAPDNTLLLPYGAMDILSVANDSSDRLCVWYEQLVDIEDSYKIHHKVSLKVYGTGFSVPYDRSTFSDPQHIITLIEGDYVWHYYSSREWI